MNERTRRSFKKQFVFQKQHNICPYSGGGRRGQVVLRITLFQNYKSKDFQMDEQERKRKILDFNLFYDLSLTDYRSQSLVCFRGIPQGESKGIHSCKPNTVNIYFLQLCSSRFYTPSILLVCCDYFSQQSLRMSFSKDVGIFKSIKFIRSSFSAFLFSFQRQKIYRDVILHYITHGCLTLSSYSYSSAVLFSA